MTFEWEDEGIPADAREALSRWVRENIVAALTEFCGDLAIGFVEDASGNASLELHHKSFVSSEWPVGEVMSFDLAALLEQGEPDREDEYGIERYAGILQKAAKVLEEYAANLRANMKP